MLNLAGTRIVKSLNRQVLTGTEILAEGTPLVMSNVGGIGMVSPCTGAALERFAGFSFSRTMLPLQAAYVEQYTITAGLGLSYTVQKPNIIAGQLRVDQVNVNGTLTNYAVQGTTPLTAVEVEAVGTVLTFNADSVGQTVNIQYRYVPTAQEAVDLFGVGDVGGISATAYLGNISVISEGDISTSEFDASCDWTSPAALVYLGANGLLTTTSTGTNVLVPGANILAAPNSQYAFLTISLGH